MYRIMNRIMKRIRERGLGLFLRTRRDVLQNAPCKTKSLASDSGSGCKGSCLTSGLSVRMAHPCVEGRNWTWKLEESRGKTSLTAMVSIE